MATYVVNNPADVLVSPAAWDRQVGAQASADRFAALKSSADATLASTVVDVKAVLVPVIQRAGGTPPDNVVITNVVKNPNGTVTITTSP